MGSVEKQGIGNAWPEGFGFRPTDDELINHLKRKTRGLKEARLLIPELNIYHWEPQTLFETYNDMSAYPSDGGECFFYCIMDGKNRKTKSGFWKETRKKHTIRGCDGENGSKRIFVYQEGRQPYGKKSSFSMHEYHLNCCTNPKIRADQGPAKEFVLCRIINRKIRKIKPNSPSECLESDLVTPGCTAANQGGKDNEASPQLCDSSSECLEPDLVTPVYTAANQWDKDNEARPQVCDSPSECLEPDLVTPGYTAANQWDKDNEASPQLCDSSSECLEPDLVTPGYTAANQWGKDNEASPQHNLTEAEAGGHWDCSEMKLQQYYESICSEHDQFNDQIDAPVNYMDYGPDDGIYIDELWR